MRKRKSMYEPYTALIKQYLEEGYNVKETCEKLKDHGVYGCYQGLYHFCRRHGLTAKLKRICQNCIYCKEYSVLETGGVIRVCDHPDFAHRNQIKAEYIPSWCNGEFVDKKTGK